MSRPTSFHRSNPCFVTNLLHLLPKAKGHEESACPQVPQQVEPPFKSWWNINFSRFVANPLHFLQNAKGPEELACPQLLQLVDQLHSTTQASMEQQFVFFYTEFPLICVKAKNNTSLPLFPI